MKTEFFDRAVRFKNNVGKSFAEELLENIEEVLVENIYKQDRQFLKIEKTRCEIEIKFRSRILETKSDLQDELYNLMDEVNRSKDDEILYEIKKSVLDQILGEIELLLKYKIRIRQ